MAAVRSSAAAAPVPAAVLTTLEATANGTYIAGEYGADGFDTVTVDVPAEEAKLDGLRAESNGYYYPEEQSLDGFSYVNVVVPTGFFCAQYSAEDFDSVLVRTYHAPPVTDADSFEPSADLYAQIAAHADSSNTALRSVICGNLFVTTEGGGSSEIPVMVYAAGSSGNYTIIFAGGNDNGGAGSNALKAVVRGIISSESKIVVKSFLIQIGTNGWMDITDSYKTMFTKPRLTLFFGTPHYVA